jgi:hypothetical protein
MLKSSNPAVTLLSITVPLCILGYGGLIFFFIYFYKVFYYTHILEKRKNLRKNLEKAKVVYRITGAIG